MNPWLFCQMLAAVLSLVAPDPSAEECKALVTPLSLADPSVMSGKVNFLLGYSDNGVYNDILKITDSSWVKMTPENGQVVMSQENRINGTCVGSSVNVTIDGDTAKVSVTNVTSVFHLLPTCDGCFVFNINSTIKNIKNLLKLMKISGDADDEVHAHALYFLSKNSTVKDSDLEHFKKQASCLGFSRDPDFHYNPDKDFCQEGEGIRMPV